MKNDALNEDVKSILSTLNTIVSVTKSDRNGATIEIVNQDPQSFETYIYKNNVADRNNDFIKLNNLINEQKQK